MVVKQGGIEKALRRDLREVGQNLRTPTGLAAAALRAARLLDDPLTPARDFASIMREFRATVETLTKGAGDDGSADATAKLLAELSTPMGNRQN